MHDGFCVWCAADEIVSMAVDRDRQSMQGLLVVNFPGGRDRQQYGFCLFVVDEVTGDQEKDDQQKDDINQWSDVESQGRSLLVLRG